MWPCLVSVLLLRAGRSSFDPAASGLHELCVRKRWNAAVASIQPLARLPRPEYERLLLVMLQEARSVEVVVLRTVGDRRTDRCARQRIVVAVLPCHRQRREVPVVSAGNSGAGIGFLMTRRTVQGGDTFAFWTAHNVGKVTMAIVTLLRVVRSGVAVDAPWMRQNGIYLLPGGEAVAL